MHDIASNYTQLTYPYSLPHEQWMLDRAVKLLVDGNIDYQVVHLSGNRAEIWRSTKPRQGGINV